MKVVGCPYHRFRKYRTQISGEPKLSLAQILSMSVESEM